MRRARQVARGIGRAALATLAFALLFPPAHALVVSPESRPPLALPVPAGAGPWVVHVVDWGYHTAVVLPQPPGWRLGPPGREQAPWLEYAWGDRRFYRDSDYRPHALFATLVLPTASVAYVVGRDAPPTTRQGARAVHARTVDGATLAALAAELERTIRRDATGARVTASAPVRGYAGRFYDAYGRYHWARDCNRWTVERLAAVGVARGGAGVVLAGQVRSRLVGFP